MKTGIEKCLKHTFCIGVTTIKWSLVQYVIYVVIPVLMMSMHRNASWFFWIYTAMYATYWELMPEKKRLKHFYAPYLVYVIIVMLCKLAEPEEVSPKYALPSFSSCLLYPFFGLACWIFCNWLAAFWKGKSWREKTFIVAGLILVDVVITWTIIF